MAENDEFESVDEDLENDGDLEDLDDSYKFWSLTVPPSRQVGLEQPEFDSIIRVTMVTFGINVEKNSRSVLMCREETGEEKTKFSPICVLNQGTTESLAVDLRFDGPHLFQVKGNRPSSITLTGFLEPRSIPDNLNMPPAGMEDEEDEDIDERMEMRKAAKNKKQKKLPQTQVQLDEEEEEEVNEDIDDESDGDDNIDDNMDDNTDEEKVEPSQESENNEESVEKQEEKEEQKAAPVKKITKEQTNQTKSQQKGKKKKKKKKKRNNNNDNDNNNDNKKSQNGNERKSGEIQNDHNEQQTKKRKIHETASISSSGKKKVMKLLKNGVTYRDIREGQGKVASKGNTVSVKYVGQLEDGTVFDKCLTSDGFSFQLGNNDVIKGWEIGVEKMRVGTKRRLIIPPKMAYGSEGNPPNIPKNATLTFTVELLGVE